jgi:hypothetical protein
MYELGRIYNDNPVVSDRAYKLQGVWLDENLSFDFHCNTVISKVSQSNYIINKCKNILPKKSLRTLYLSLVHPHLLYCLPIFGCTSRKNIKKNSLLYRKKLFVMYVVPTIMHILHHCSLSLVSYHGKNYCTTLRVSWYIQ